MNTSKQQRLALRHLDEARRVYRWWRWIALADALAAVASALGGVATAILFDGPVMLLGLLGWPMACGFGAWFHRAIWPPLKKAFITRRDAQWAWEDAMLADEEAESAR